MSTLPDLNLPERYLEKVQRILKTHVPEYDVWAYGSRVTGNAFDASDLDLVLRNPQDLKDPCDKRLDLLDAFIESDLPIRVDVMDWARIPESFWQEIERQYVVVQTGRD